MATKPITIEVKSSPPGRTGAAELGRSRSTLLPARAWLSFEEGLEFLNHGEARAAADCLEQALALAPDFADGHVALGVAYALDFRVYPALDHLERAAVLEPNNFYAHFKLAQFCFKLRLPQRGYAEASRALECAASLEERKLVAQLLREERQREKNGVARPWWNKPFSLAAVFVGAGLLTALLVALVFSLH